MGVRNYLIEGLSGAGKTAVAEELERRGRHVVHGDRELAYHGDPDTGEPWTVPAGAHGPDAVSRRHRGWIWNVDRVRSLIADRSRPETFLCGGSRNHSRYIHLFDRVFVLDVDLDTLKRRVAGRTDDEFGARPAEWELLAGLHATKEDMPKGATIIDGARPVARVVDEILSLCAASKG
ncbi:MAG: nucleoside kinase [Brevundimonas sp.]|nr:MAG: nucleoside kinase [Brevundimonas sp.]